MYRDMHVAAVGVSACMSASQQEVKHMFRLTGYTAITHTHTHTHTNKSLPLSNQKSQLITNDSDYVKD